MKRSVLAVDRLVAVVLGVVLVAAGVLAAAWGSGQLTRWWPQAPDRLDLGAARDAVDAGWFGAACAGFALVTAVLAVWWLLAHVPRQGVKTLGLTGSGPAGQLRLSADGPADAAAEELALTPGVRSAGGRTIDDRGELVVELRALVEPTADLAVVARAAEEVSTQLRGVLGREDARGRVRLSVARNDRSQRVH
ncbi:hypothetical protein [Kineococcus sp. SYSU DK002]|uniref:hypothetical protein n=1 Tax=Kineococcus sp. SYSU DK002 TaxID=3383123 RepID=UPI003D7DCE37